MYFPFALRPGSIDLQEFSFSISIEITSFEFVSLPICSLALFGRYKMMAFHGNHLVHVWDHLVPP
uniref:Uncharacterized protein n=1 Tax=Triticum urartu TaxID=4572 RepID=A0A8R7PHZ5_TRIUA